MDRMSGNSEQQGRDHDARVLGASLPRKLRDELAMRRFVRYEVSRSQEVAKANREAKPKIGTWTVSGGVKPVKTKQDFVCGSVPKPTYPNFPRPGLGNGTAGTVHAEQVKQTVRRPSYLGAEKKKTITIYPVSKRHTL